MAIVAGVMVWKPSVTLKVTGPKFEFVLENWLDARFMFVVLTAVLVADATPPNVKSSVVYSVVSSSLILMLVTS